MKRVKASIILILLASCLSCSTANTITYFRKNLTVFLCHIVDGPCEYSGDTMQDIHRGMYINKNQFNHFVELFIDAMEAAEISYPMQNQLLARLAPLRESIIKI